MIGKCNSGAGGGNAFYATIVVYAASKSTITATKGSDTIPCTWNGSSYACVVTDTGTWTISKGSTTRTVNVTEDVNSYSVSFITLTITGAGSTTTDTSYGSSYVDYNGTKITTAQVINMLPTDKIKIYVKSCTYVSDYAYYSDAVVSFNGEYMHEYDASVAADHWAQDRCVLSSTYRFRGMINPYKNATVELSYGEHYGGNVYVTN